MQRTFESCDRAADGTAKIRQRRYDHASRKSRSVKAVFGVECQRTVKRFNHVGFWNFPLANVEEVFRERQILTWENQIFAFPNSLKHRDQRRDLCHQRNAFFNGGFRCVGSREFFLHPKETDAGSKCVHRVTVFWKTTQHFDQVVANVSRLSFLLAEFIQLCLGWQFPVQQ